MAERDTPMNNEPNKPIAAQELTEKELEGIVGGKENTGGSGSVSQDVKQFCTGFSDVK